MNLRLPLPVALSLLLATACGGSSDDKTTSDGGADAAIASGPTFTRVASEVVNATSCGSAYCHGTAAGGLIVGSRAQTYAALVNKPASGLLCGAAAHASDGGTASSADGGTDGSTASSADSGTGTYLLVVPGDPEQSLLYLKLARTPPCGNAMPLGSAVSADQLQLVYDWIAAGAKDD